MTEAEAASNSDPIELVLAALDELKILPLGDVAPRLAATRARLTEPLRIAVAGRLKSGKSTLVNALLGQRVAPTDVGECTKVVTWFRYGAPERVELQLRDGDTRELPLDADGALPRDLGVPADRVASLQVWLSNDVLRSATLIDTPGLASVDAESVAATREFLMTSSTAAADAADAMLFVVNSNVRADERDTIRDFAGAHGVLGSAANSLAVLTKADRLDSDGDPWAAATQLAKRLAERHADDVATVVPVVGLWAETARTGAFGEADADVVQALAGAAPSVISDAFISADRFLATRVGTKQQRQRLLRLLGLTGVEHLVDAARSGSTGAVLLSEELIRAAGIEALTAAIDDAFRQRSAPLRAWRAVTELQRLAYLRDVDPATRETLRDIVERLRFHPALHRVAELEALSQCCSGEVELPAELLDELRDVALTPAPAAGAGVTADDAMRSSRRWRVFALSADPRQARIARVMMRSYRLAAQR